MSEEIQRKSTQRDLVPAKYYEIFGYRLLGFKYDKIAEKTGYQPQTIRRLFSRGGPLNGFWRNWMEDAKKENVEETMDMMFGHLPDLMRQNILDAKMPDSMVGLLARKIIFEYTLGKPEDRLKVDAKVGVYTFADWIKAETLKDKNDADQQKEVPAQSG